MDIERFKLDNDTMEKMRDSMVIFDDVDQIHETKTRKKIYNCINEILCNGRHFDIDLIVTNHHLSDYRNTRTILNESNSITIFPRSGCSHQIEHVLKNYVGLSKDQIEKIKNLPSRWVTIFKRFPLCVLYSSGVYIL